MVTINSAKKYRRSTTVNETTVLKLKFIKKPK